MTDQRGQLPLRTATVVGSCAFALFLGACAIANTPQQDLAYARWAKCNSPYVQLQQIDLDGRITFRSATAGSGQEVLQCLADVGRTGPPLPEPVGVRPREACERSTRRLPVVALGFAGCSMPSYDRALHALRTWMDSWAGIGRVAVGMHRQGYDLQ
jgi:hypothetical protein